MNGWSRALLLSLLVSVGSESAFAHDCVEAGESGTLKKRLRSLKGRVRGKTGTLNDTPARALVGFVERPGKPGGDCVFAIILNSRRATHALVDDIVREIAR